MEYIPVRVSDIIRQVNRDIYLPAIQREFVWGMDRVERLFDSIMADFPIGSFLYWKLEQKHKDEWPVYEFVRDFDAESPHTGTSMTSTVPSPRTLCLLSMVRSGLWWKGCWGRTTLAIPDLDADNYSGCERRTAMLHVALFCLLVGQVPPPPAPHLPSTPSYFDCSHYFRCLNLRGANRLCDFQWYA